MIAKIFENGAEINRIVADEAFAAQYCEENGYTYEMEPEEAAPAEPEYTEFQILGQQITDLELMILGGGKNV